MTGKGFADAAVVQPGPGCAAEAVGDGGDDESAFPLRLETGGAVAVPAVGRVDVHELSGGAVIGPDAGDDVFGLHAVGADVLHGRCARLAGNERQVFRPPEALGGRPGAEIVEDNACAEGDRFFASLRMTGMGGMTDGHMKDCSGEVFGKEEVGAAAHHQHRPGQGAPVQGRQVGLFRHFHKQGALHPHPEGVPAGKVKIWGL